ncbi:hypothetical protein [Streptomyces niveus]
MADLAVATGRGQIKSGAPPAANSVASPSAEAR